MKSFSTFFLFIASFVSLAMFGNLRADESRYVLNPASVTAETTHQPTTLPRPSRQHPVRTLVSSLAIVLGAFLLLSFVLRKKDRSELSEHQAMELMQHLGELSITPQVKLSLVRVGPRLLVLHVGDKSVQTVAEISDPDEVAQVLGRDSFQPQPESRVDDLLRTFEKPKNLSNESSFERPQSHGRLTEVA